MVNQIIIKFDGNSKGVFYSDEMVKLTVELRMDKTIKRAKYLSLTMLGFSEITWNEGVKGWRPPVTYRGEQVFVNSVNYFFGKETATELTEVSAGVHMYKCAHKIPGNAPGSLEGKFGFIRYKVEVSLAILSSPDLRSELSFTVIRLEDLNRYQDLKMSNHVEEVKIFRFCGCDSEPIMVELATLKTGFAMGETVNVKVRIYNRSNLKFIRSAISLRRVETFHSDMPTENTRKHMTTLLTISTYGVDSKKNARFEQALTLPEVMTVSNDHISSVFQLTHEIRFFMQANDPSSIIEALLPISIGHTGFRMDSAVSLDSQSLPMDNCPPFCMKIESEGKSHEIPRIFDFTL